MSAVPKRLYVAGPMSDLPDYNYPAFNHAASELRVAAFEVENPAENAIETENYHDYLRAGLAQLLRCDGVAVLEGWWLSGGARWEVATAGTLGLPVRPVDEWLRLADAAQTAGPAAFRPSREDIRDELAGWVIEVKAEALEGMAAWFQLASDLGTGERDAIAAQACIERAASLRGESHA